MRFPGQRERKHFFPVSHQQKVQDIDKVSESKKTFDIIGIDQTILDVVFHCDDAFLESYGISKKNSIMLEASQIEEIYELGKKEKKISSMYAGGAVANTLHNYSVLSGHGSLLLGMMSENIAFGGMAYRYIRTTAYRTSMRYMKTMQGSIATAMTFVTPDGERTFAISPGIVNEYTEENIPFSLLDKAYAVVGSLFLLRNESTSIYHAQIRLLEEAHQRNLVVAFSLGLKELVIEKKDLVFDLLQKYVHIVAMNSDEAEALTSYSHPLESLQQILDYTDLVLITDGKKGIYIGAWCSEEYLRETDELHSKTSFLEYNKYEFSRAQKKKDCLNPVKIFTHINPYMGGPEEIVNTNGAGDCALAALLHDVCANSFSKEQDETSPKHVDSFLTYSSLARIAQYANLASYHVLQTKSPRLLSAEKISI